MVISNFTSNLLAYFITTCHLDTLGGVLQWVYNATFIAFQRTASKRVTCNKKGGYNVTRDKLRVAGGANTFKWRFAGDPMMAQHCMRAW